MSADNAGEQTGPSGFGGWLTLVVIGQTLGPLVTVMGVLASLPAYREMMLVPNGPVAVYGEVALNAAFLIIQIIAVVAMYRRSRNYPRIFLCQWLAVIALVLGDALLVAEALHLPVFQVLQYMDVRRTLGSPIVAGLWTIYMFSSVRVRNTFTR